MTYLMEIVIKLIRVLAQNNSRLQLVRSNYSVDGIELTICDNETKQIAMFLITAFPEAVESALEEKTVLQNHADWDDGFGRDEDDAAHDGSC